jgi:hypothetical protein
MNHNSLKKFYILLLPFLVFLLHLPFVFAKPHSKQMSSAATLAGTVKTEKASADSIAASSVYETMNLDQLGLSREAFNYAVQGFNYLLSTGKLNNNHILSIVDFSLPAGKKRLFVIDMEKRQVLFNTYVAHGRNSGKEYANQFSNSPESFKSSLGFYITKGTYNGQHGYSLQLEGEEKGINDNALSRAIVIHSADYVNENVVKSQGYVGRSLGCPALPAKFTKPIIQTIKDGSCFFMFSPKTNYVSKSQILQLAS